MKHLMAGSTKAGDAPRKLLDVLRTRANGWNATTRLHEDLAKTYDWFLSRAEDPGA